MMVGPAAVNECGMLQSHAQVFTEVANSRRVVLGCRALNPLCESLLKEGHASKGFYIKAKSCDWGPMAGLVLVDPRFSKERDTTKQAKYVNMALEKGAGQENVVISSSRLMELTNLGLVSQVEKVGGITATEVKLRSASSHGGSFNFVARRVGNTEPIWAIFLTDANGKEQPVKGLTNKPVPAAGRQPIGPKAVVAGDYDLFCVWGRHHNNRALGTGPNIITRGNGQSHIAKTYVNHVKDRNGSGGSEDPDMGNVSVYSTSIIQQLNAGINSKTGYRGGNMIHHNDESGNPFTPGADFPLIFFVPGIAPRSISSISELRGIYELCERQGYAVERNPGFTMR